MSQPILVTGATGTVGSEVVKALVECGHKVRAAAHSLIKGDRLRHPLVEICEIDFSKPESLEMAFTGVSKAFLITPFADNQVEMARQLVEQAKKCGISHIVRLSASGAEAEPGIQLGRWHREAEKLIEESGIPWTHLRPNSYMQNFIHYQGESICKNSAIYMPLGEGKISYIDARDIGKVASIILTEDGHYSQAYTLTGPEALSMSEVAHHLSQAIGRAIQYVDVPEADAKQGMTSAGMPAWMVDAMLELNATGKAGYAASIDDSVEKLTGTKPRRFAEFAQENRAAWLPGEGQSIKQRTE
jgi:uncharacterized protein YbjT (DUF2867 family)